ncbi:MAG TPA: TonB-dependent receptor, partial [Tenacibaculum sp.]|nr:TonB-dependent receptor [Tenacibaculum sp.]
EARGFYRLPNQSRTYTPAYINGFLPQIHSTIGDISIATGIRGGVGKWNIDFSNNWGRNSFLYNIRNSSNASMLQSTPFEANAGGGYSYAENTANFDMSRFYEDTMAGLNIAFGLEYRTENYNIKAGDEDSYAQFNTNGNIHNPTDPTSIVGTDFFGNNRPSGIQVFPGFKPENEVDENRNSIAAYFDVEADFTENFMTSAAVRFENYSDFGNTTNFKLASRYKINENLSMRGGIQSGFRAPSLHQIHYKSTSTIFVDITPNEVGTFSNTSRVARILGIDPLKEETSLGGSVGITAKIPSLNTKVTIDGYMIKIDDRVVYTGSFGDNGNSELANLFAQANATSAAFFANAVDTKTSGIDIVVDNKININDDISFTNTLAFTFSKTDIESINIPSAISNAGLSETYFDKTSRTYIESAVPRTKGNLSHNLKIGDKWNFYLRNSYFGEVTEATNLNVSDSGLTENDFDFGAKIITDLSAGYNISEVAKLTIGTNNLFDIYPDQAAMAFRSSGRFIWSRRSQQFGTNGRYIFARLNFTLK